MPCPPRASAVKIWDGFNKRCGETMRTLIALLLFVGLSFPALATDKESAYDRVMRTGMIRCGYIIWPPFMDRDVETKKFSGMNYDYAESLAETLGLKIEWALELTPGSQVEALKSGKIDAICTAEGPIVPSTIKYISYSIPIAYFPFYLYARSDDNRFGKGAADILAADNKNVKIATIDGDISGMLAGIHFKNASLYPLPQMASPTQMMLDVASGKADIVINDPLSMTQFFQNNPGKLRRIGTDAPIAVIPNTFSVLRGHQGRELIELFNQGIENIKNSGKEKIILEKYQDSDGKLPLYTTSKPYEVQ